MQTVIWIVPILPIAGFIILTLFGRRSAWQFSAVVGAGTVGVSALLALVAGLTLAGVPDAGRTVISSLGDWVVIPGFSVDFSLRLDVLSDLMAMVITVVAFLIHLYSTAFMRGKGDYHRYFAYLNLFVGSMLLLVLGNNLLLLFVGWEGVGLCSYLLIGFWYEDPTNGLAANKAFIVTRIADAALLVGLFLTISTFGTLDISQVLSRASSAGSSPTVTAIAALLLVGAIGKSAQLPFQLWLPDAMAGPTPVSALIHAATMVTAGVYLVARMHLFYVLSPGVQLAVAIIGAATLLYGGLSALTQHDIKRVLAYSTISQIGYMFLGLGVGAWSAAMFHFMNHAFFKALLFLGAGVVIHRLNGEHNIMRMGGIRRTDRPLFWLFLTGAAALTGIPLVTSGFYSKEAILESAWIYPVAGPLFWAIGAFGVFLTGAYIFRLFFHVFLGESKKDGGTRPASFIFYPPMILLAVGAVLAGFLRTPRDLGNVQLMSNFLNPVLAPEQFRPAGLSTEVMLQIVTALLSLLAVFAAYLSYRRSTKSKVEEIEPHGIKRFLYTGMGADWLATSLVVRPFLWFAGIMRRDWVDLFYNGVAQAGLLVNRALRYTQSGLVRWYLLGIGIGVLVMLGMVVFS
ncbi:MAG TPA: NADH-quinone oxidoreductase subunit L [Spirochaetia bacterium]|nr:NADH-quinone oxidoreductase subunit L [Spirochaetia bacterium]